MQKVHAELGLGASELGHYTAIRYTALDLTCATIGACMRADLIDRVSMLWSSFLDSLPQGDEAKLAALVEWLRSEAQDVVESGLRDPLTDIDPEQFKNTAAVPRLAQR
jgi:hypothetical protein